MFDIGFWELSLIGIVGLLVIGPERMPAVARTVGKWVGRANRFISNIKDDINKELKDEDLKKILAEQQKLADEFNNLKLIFDFLKLKKGRLEEKLCCTHTNATFCLMQKRGRRWGFGGSMPPKQRCSMRTSTSSDPCVPMDRNWTSGGSALDHSCVTFIRVRVLFKGSSTTRSL